MTVDPERLKVAMEAAQRFSISDLSFHDRILIEAAITALDAHDRQSKAPGDAVARLAEIAKAADDWPAGSWVRHIYDLATRPLAEAPAQSLHAETLQTIVDVYDARSELFTDESDLAANLRDRAAKALGLPPTTPDPPPDTVPFTREMAELIDRIAANVVYLLDMNDASEDSLLVESGRLGLFPPNPKDNRDAP